MLSFQFCFQRKRKISELEEKIENLKTKKCDLDKQLMDAQHGRDDTVSNKGWVDRQMDEVDRWTDGWINRCKYGRDDTVTLQ